MDSIVFWKELDFFLPWPELGPYPPPPVFLASIFFIAPSFALIAFSLKSIFFTFYSSFLGSFGGSFL